MTTKVHKIGSKFELHADYGDGLEFKGTVMLVQVEAEKICLICLETGNRWADPVSIADRSDISIDGILVSGTYLSEIEVALGMQDYEFLRPLKI